MNILVAVPSKDRVDIWKKYTGSWLTKLEHDYKTFVEPQDEEKYKSAEIDVEVLDKNDKGLGYAKSKIIEYAEENGYDLIMKCDDDIRGFTRLRKVNETPEKSAQTLDNALNDINDFMESYPAVGVVGFPYRNEMYDREDIKKGFTTTKAVRTCYVSKPKYFCPDPEIKVFEDFSVGIACLADGERVFKYHKTGIDLGKSVGEGKGGHQAFDRKERALDAAERLREIYPPLTFREVDKRWGIEPDVRSIKI